MSASASFLLLPPRRCGSRTAARNGENARNSWRKMAVFRTTPFSATLRRRWLPCGRACSIPTSERCPPATARPTCSRRRRWRRQRLRKSPGSARWDRPVDRRRLAQDTPGFPSQDRPTASRPVPRCPRFCPAGNCPSVVSSRLPTSWPGPPLWGTRVSWGHRAAPVLWETWKVPSCVGWWRKLRRGSGKSLCRPPPPPRTRRVRLPTYSRNSPLHHKKSLKSRCGCRGSDLEIRAGMRILAFFRQFLWSHQCNCS